MDVTEDVTSTLRAESHHPPLVFENHSQDSRYTGPRDVAQTVLSTFGTGGNNQPFVVQTPKTLKIRSCCEGGGKGALIQENLSVRKVEEMVKALTEGESVKSGGKKIIPKGARLPEEYNVLKQSLSKFFQAKVQLTCSDKGKGKISIPFANEEELERIIELFDRLKS